MEISINALWYYAVQAILYLLHISFYNVLGAAADELVGGLVSSRLVLTTLVMTFDKLRQVWWANCQRYSVFLPYLWPLQDRTIGVWIVVLVVNLLLRSLCMTYRPIVLANIITSIRAELPYGKYSYL
jgi:hypothetical protein